MPFDYNEAASKADYKDRPPFHDMEGSFIVVIESDKLVDERKTDNVNVCIWRIVKVLSGPPGVVGRRFTRRRPAKSDGTINEWQNRYTVALSMNARLRKKDRDPHFEFPKAKYTGATIKSIHDTDGAIVSGYPIRVESRQVSMKTKDGDFTVCEYTYPTAADLEGIALDENGMVVG